jgi:hypothetical protein
MSLTTLGWVKLDSGSLSHTYWVKLDVRQLVTHSGWVKLDVRQLDFRGGEEGPWQIQERASQIVALEHAERRQGR